MIRSSNENNLTRPKGVDITFSLFIMNKMELYLENSSWILLSPITRDVEAEAGSGSGGSGTFSVEAEVRKIHRFRFHTGGKNGERKKLVLLSFVEEQIGRA